MSTLSGQDHAAAINDDWTATAFDIGGKVSVAGFKLVGYYDGEGVGTTSFLMDAAATVGGQAKERDSDGYYVQATYKLPGVGTKLGVSYGESNLDKASGETARLWSKKTAPGLSVLTTRLPRA